MMKFLRLQKTKFQPFPESFHPILSRPPDLFPESYIRASCPALATTPIPDSCSESRFLPHSSAHECALVKTDRPPEAAATALPMSDARV